MTSVFLSHRSDFTFLSAFPSSYLIFQFLAFDPNSRFKTQISSSKRFTSVKDKVPKMYRVSQKNALSECCWSHNALAQSSFAGTPFGTPCIQQGADWRGAFKTCYTWEPATSSSGWQERASLKTARAFGVGSDSGQLIFVINNSSKEIF